MKKYTPLLVILIFLCFNAKAQEYITEKNINYYPDSINNKDEYTKSQCTLDFYYPKDLKNFPTIVWIHGGGMTHGEKQLPKSLMNKGYAIVGVEYRLSPKVNAPAYIEDAAAAVAWVYKNIEKYGGSTKLIFLSGHSAGGYLDLMVTLDKSYLAKYNIDANTIAACIPFSGEAITHYTVRKERGIKNTQPIIDKYAPLYFVRADAPPLILISGDREKELLGRYEETAYLWRMMKLVGHTRTTITELTGFDHGGMAKPAYPLLLKAVADITKEIMEKK